MRTVKMPSLCLLSPVRTGTTADGTREEMRGTRVCGMDFCFDSVQFCCCRRGICGMGKGTAIEPENSAIFWVWFEEDFELFLLFW
jgi:hypothetical protein